MLIYTTHTIIVIFVTFVILAIFIALAISNYTHRKLLRELKNIVVGNDINVAKDIIAFCNCKCETIQDNDPIPFNTYNKLLLVVENNKVKKCI